MVSGYWFMLIAYGLAKVFEYFDEAVFNNLGIISGHSLKHILAALGVLFLLRSYIKRERFSRRKPGSSLAVGSVG